MIKLERISKSLSPECTSDKAFPLWQQKPSYIQDDYINDRIDLNIIISLLHVINKKTNKIKKNK